MVVCFWILIFVSVMFVVVLCGCLGIRRLWGWVLVVAGWFILEFVDLF